MKTPTAEPQAKKSGHSTDIGTWLSVVLAVLLVIKLGVILSRHI